MATDLISIFIGLFFMTIGIWILNYIIVIEFELHENFLAMLISVILFAVSPALAFFAGRSIYSPSNSDEKNCYEITVNEKSFKTSRFKTNMNGSIEFTADDGTAIVIRASEYEIRKLN